MSPGELSEALARLEAEYAMSRTRLGLGGSHTVVTYPPLDALPKFEGDEPFAIAPGGVHLYFHVAFCEYMCSFCHYHKSYTGATREAKGVAPYMAALEQEIELRRGALSGSEIGSVYLGGGTPTALSEQRLGALLEAIGTLASLRHTAFSAETSPKTAAGQPGRRKLQLLKDAGLDRISMGVQSFDPEILENQRGHGLDILEDALANLQELKISINLDLIQDMPLQSEESVQNDIAAINRLRPEQVTWYTLRAHKGSALAKIYASSTTRNLVKLSSIADAHQSAQVRLAIINGMKAIGYSVAPGGRFLRDAETTDLYKCVRGGLSRNLLGFGVSAYSHGWDYFFRNIGGKAIMEGTEQYINRLAAGKSAVDHCMRVDGLELIASQLCEATRRFVPASMVEQDGAPYEIWRATLARCTEAGLFERVAGGLQPTMLGRLFEEEVASLFYSEPIRKILQAKGAYWADDSWFERNVSTVAQDASLSMVA